VATTTGTATVTGAGTVTAAGSAAQATVVGAGSVTATATVVERYAGTVTGAGQVSAGGWVVTGPSILLCHRTEVRVYDHTGAGSYSVLPATSIKFSSALGGGGVLTLEAAANAEPLATTPTLLDDCVIKLALPLDGDDSTLTEVAAYAARGRSGVLWDGAGTQVRRVTAPTLWTVWAQDAVLHTEGNQVPQYAAPERHFGWMSSIYDPAADTEFLWGAPTANAGRQDSTTGARAGQPAEWPTELGHAKWITRGAVAAGTRHLFVADVTLTSAKYCSLYFSADESCAVYFAGELVLQTSASETGYQQLWEWSGYVEAGTYRVGIDKTSVVSRGGDGRDPVLLGLVAEDNTGDVDSVLLVTNTTDWKIHTLDPVNGVAPSLTPGEIVLELHGQAQDRDVTTWDALTADFTATADSDGLPWPVREERAWRVGYDRHLDMIEGLGDLGLAPTITPGRVLQARSAQGTPAPAVVLEALVNADTVTETGVGVAATTLFVETQDGWTTVTNTAAEAAHGRREAALSLGNAPSVAQGRRLGQKVLDERLARPTAEWSVDFYARPGCVPFKNFGLGDTITVRIGGVDTQRVVLELGGQADHQSSIIRWSVKTGEVL